MHSESLITWAQLRCTHQSLASLVRHNYKAVCAGLARDGLMTSMDQDGIDSRNQRRASDALNVTAPCSPWPGIAITLEPPSHMRGSQAPRAPETHAKYRVNFRDRRQARCAGLDPSVPVKFWHGRSRRS